MELTETLSELGLCITKHRLSNLSTSMGNTVIEANEKNGVAIQMNLKRGVFFNGISGQHGCWYQSYTFDYFSAWNSSFSKLAPSNSKSTRVKIKIFLDSKKR